MRVMVAMSGGVDSSVAAALVQEAGHEVVGVTMKLWGGAGDSGCCSVGDVEDARRVADQLRIVHRVFNFSEAFEAAVVSPYVSEHAAGRTPNPCVECNRHLKFGRLLDRAVSLGCDALATGHHARAVSRDGRIRLLRGADAAKDQSYVLAVLSKRQLARILLPVGDLTKEEVRRRARQLGLRTADKPDSQDVCFVASSRGRAGFLSDRIELHEGRLSGTDGATLGAVQHVEMVTVGQRRGLGHGPDGRRRYALHVDTASGTVVVGDERDLLTEAVSLTATTWTGGPLAEGRPVLAQCSAHGAAWPATVTANGLRFEQPRRRPAPGQTVALYEGDAVVGSGVAGR